jgi:anaphase-promoting complex subunit 10
MDLREIGNHAQWTLSSAKQGNGINRLLDGTIDTFYQSDGTQPHTITVQFLKTVNIKSLYIYIDQRQDESYTPKEFIIRIGNDIRDLKEICTVNVETPEGWQEITFDPKHKDGVVRGSILQFCITKNFQNGRDTHVRWIKIFAPSVSLFKEDFVTNKFIEMMDIR